MRPLLGVIDFLCMQGYRKNAGMNYNATALANAITEYDAATSAYRAFGLSNVFAASLYHPYYLCLGTSCNCAFDPPAGAMCSTWCGW
eukprot:m.786342 g.786342  ORF g.786342 m.786342 type:complete len:87 (-) comp23305_c1_seq31:1818-2078(-)